jgi:SAM-dependent methyltransferase
MPDAAPREWGLLFNSVAEDYDAVRPDYPEELFDDLQSLAGLGLGAQVLEIGCGTGLATRSLLDRGWEVHAVEPGEDMARVARRRLQGRPLTIDTTTFEECDPAGSSFDLVFSATAFHWVDPSQRWSKTSSVLAEGGHLALATNRTVAGNTFGDLYDASRELHRRHGFNMEDGEPDSDDELRRRLAAAPDDIGALWSAADPKGGEATAEAFFEAPVVRTYLWERDYTAHRAAMLLSTYSPYLAVPAERRAPLLEGIEKLVNERFGGVVRRRYLSVLAVARRAG